MTNNEQWMGKAEAAEALGVSVRQVKRYMDAGLLEWDRDRVSNRVKIARTSVGSLKRQRSRPAELTVSGD